MRFIACLLAVALCSCTFLRSVAPEAKGCATQAAKAVAAELLPKVESVLLGGAPDWKAQLDVLKLQAGEALVCAVQVAVAHFSGGGAVESRALTFGAPTYDLGAERGREYLNSP